MEETEIAIKLLADDKNFAWLYGRYIELLMIARSYKNHWKKDLTSINKYQLHHVVNDLGECLRFVDEVVPTYDFKFNTVSIKNEYNRVQQELNRRTRKSMAKPSLKEIRQRKARESKTHGRGKNR